MRAIVHRGPRLLVLEDRAAPLRSTSEDVILRPLLTGICGTDRGIVMGTVRARPGIVIGHECVALVVDAASVTGLSPGDRVVLNPTLACGNCARCQRGETRFCASKGILEIGVSLDGTLSSVFRAPATSLHAIPDDMPVERAVMVEPLACVLSSARAVGVSDRDSVAVIGGGPIGLLWALVAAHAGAEVLVLERDPFRRRFASHFFETFAFEEIAASRRYVSVAVDTTGVEAERAAGLLMDGGRIGMMGCNVVGRIDLSSLEVTARCLSIIGSSDCHADDFPVAIDVANKLPVENLLTHVVAFDDWHRAFELLGLAHGTGYGGMKVAISGGDE